MAKRDPIVSAINRLHRDGRLPVMASGRRFEIVTNGPSAKLKPGKAWPLGYAVRSGGRRRTGFMEKTYKQLYAWIATLEVVQDC